MIIGMIRNANWSDPQVRSAFISGFISGLSGKSSQRYSGSYDSDDYGSYVIQYRRHGSWIDGPGSNEERVAESMFDQFLANDPRAVNRCRLVYKVNGRVKSVLSTN